MIALNVVEALVLLLYVPYSKVMQRWTGSRHRSSSFGMTFLRVDNKRAEGSSVNTTLVWAKPFRGRELAKCSAMAEASSLGTGAISRTHPVRPRAVSTWDKAQLRAYLQGFEAVKCYVNSVSAFIQITFFNMSVRCLSKRILPLENSLRLLLRTGSKRSLAEYRQTALQGGIHTDELKFGVVHRFCHGSIEYLLNSFRVKDIFHQWPPMSGMLGQEARKLRAASW